PRTRPYPTYFRLSGTDELQAQVAADYAVHTLNRHRITVVDGEPRYGTTLGDRFAVHAAALGASVTSLYPEHGDGGDSGDLDEIVAALDGEAPDLVYVSTGASFAGKLRSRLADSGASIQILGSDALLEPRYTDETRTAADGDLITSLLTPATRLPAAGAFVAAYSARYGGPADDEGATAPATRSPDMTPSADAFHSHAPDASRGPDAARASGPSRAIGAAMPAHGAGLVRSGMPAARAAVAAPPDRDDVDGPGGARTRQAAHEAAEELAQRQAEAIPAVAAYAYDATRAIIRAAATVLPGRMAVDAAARHDIAAAIGRGTFAGVTGSVAFDRWGDTRRPSVELYTILGGRLVALATRTG
ncbi:ABC transporter substrate-binding protein, partial [Frankia canadensis]|uniref:ABC transporter substrate-binding protein n=1 Tax=Frankia canadensis TaxID=1836972 RepID=UPI001401BBCA